jgi:8-oxo-dGTP pyrophosphatase MutT (NUDIX family)
MRKGIFNIVALEANQLPFANNHPHCWAHGELVCLCRHNDQAGILTEYDIPGGGVEPGDTLEETVVKECLEEVGMLVNGIEILDAVDIQHHEHSLPDRAERYSGTHNTYYAAVYVGQDASLHGDDDDTMHYEWLTVLEAIQRIEQGPVSPFNAGRIKALQLL